MKGVLGQSAFTPLIPLCPKTKNKFIKNNEAYQKIFIEKYYLNSFRYRSMPRCALAIARGV